MTFKRVHRKPSIIEIRPATVADLNDITISKSNPDKLLSIGDFIKGVVARDPRNHNDMWYINSEFYKNNYEE